MQPFPRMFIYKEFSIDDVFYRIMETCEENDFFYDFNNNYFFNNKEMSKEELLNFYSFCLDNNLNFKILNDNCFKVDNTNAIGTFCLNRLSSNGCVSIEDNSIFIENYNEESCLYFIMNLDKIDEKYYEVNVVDIKKKLFFKDTIKVKHNNNLIEQTVRYYKKNKEEIIKQGFDKSVAFTVIEHSIYVNDHYVVP